jgi:hypothetical protein
MSFRGTAAALGWLSGAHLVPAGRRGVAAVEAGSREGEEPSWLVEDAPDEAVVGAATEGPVTLLARVSFEDACAETAASFRDSRGETVGETLGESAGRTRAAKANSGAEASG